MTVSTILLILFAANFLALVLNIAFWVVVSLGEKKIRQQERSMYAKFNEVLEKANKEASDLLLQATEKSNTLLRNTEVMVDDIRNEMRNSFASAKDKNAALLERALVDINNQNKQFLHDTREQLLTDAKGLMGTIVTDIKGEMHMFVEDVKKETVVAQHDIESKLDQEFKAAMEDVAHYKQAQYQLVDQKINTIIKQVTAEVLTNAISIEEHEQLIIKSLERAVEEGGLSV